jgi:uncharacterized protein YdhG (YjbR/CyaY superfamily)
MHMPAKKKNRRPAARRTSRQNGTSTSVDEYISRLPAPTRDAVKKLRAALRSVMPSGATEVISYGIPAFRGDRILVWYAGFAKHISLFPTAAVISQFKEELKAYSISKGTIKFPLDTPLPAVLIKRIVKARIEAERTR